MAARPERRRLLAALCVAALVLPAPGGNVWQPGGRAPDFVDASSHRGADVLAFDTGSSTLASGGWDGEIALWVLGSAKPERVWQAHKSSAQGRSFHGEQLISGGQDGRLILWGRTGQVRHSLDTGSGITHMQVLNERIVTGHYDGSVSVIERDGRYRELQRPPWMPSA